MPRTSWKHMCEFEFAVPGAHLLNEFHNIVSSLYEKADL